MDLKPFAWTLSCVLALGGISAREAGAYDFWDQGLVSGTVNTTFTDANLGTAGHPITYSYCLFSPPDPFTPVPPLNPTPNHYVINTPVCSLSSPTTWSGASTGWAQNGVFGASNYWVLDINNETSAPEQAFSPCNQGPPDYSLPRSEPGSGVMGFTVLKDAGAGENFYRAHLVLNMAFSNPCPDPISFMAIGAQDTRGNGGLIGGLNPTAGVPSKVSFTAKIWDHKTPDRNEFWNAGATFFRLIAVAQWQDSIGRDVPRMIQLNLYHDTLNDGFVGRGWNWPLRQSFYFPGADIAYIDVEELPAYCSGYSLPTFTSVGQQIDYDVDLQQLFQCASDGGLFRDPLPASANVMLRAVHWAAEAVGSDGWLWVSVHDMRMSTMGQTPANPRSTLSDDVQRTSDIGTAILAKCNATPSCVAALRADMDYASGMLRSNAGAPADPLVDKKVRARMSRQTTAGRLLTPADLRDIGNH